MRVPKVDAALLLRAYADGLFPMGLGRDHMALTWHDPESRGIIPLDAFHQPKRLARTLKAGPFTFTVNTAFEEVIDACAAPRPDAPDTWINPPIRALYGELHAMGYAHSLETRHEGKLVGGLYGVALGGAFFGESMFSRMRDASKAALVKLVERLKDRGFTLLDTQYITGHLAQFGAVEIPRRDYLKRLRAAIAVKAAF